MLFFNIISPVAIVAFTSALTLPRSTHVSTPRFLTTQDIYVEPREAPICFNGQGSVATGVNEGISTLRSRAAHVANGFSLIPLAQNGGQCVRLTCSYNVGIWACNDADVGALVTYENIARYAENIRDACGPASNGIWVHGQQFASEINGLRWNVIVGRDDGGC
ncbi:hypothetical protein PFICI_14830 [Pestalotiopsis fici W106-1]|uniref:Ecp2 effector protein domain-containing protein n=1 Tax=Pestalotiopsis fici (strain W106-1 / CGMCC3.15140) TaxID=1229662 RepID=W3WJE2_PESFW|nr:uncharacterized protein PFICI_14830 [Pestalotiopsis fici W106-1]ETS73884.1 hypothetical protein PFICI_14830 [Pestalotiopsis fici W106-1]